jgi:hypothetical protein
MSLEDDLTALDNLIQQRTNAKNGDIDSSQRADGTSTAYVSLIDLLRARRELLAQIDESKSPTGVSPFKPIRVFNSRSKL